MERLQTAGLRLLAEEATLLLLGIYEDTGSLTYDTTTARDAQAAAWLLEQGAQLNVVRRFLNIPLTPEQQRVLQNFQMAETAKSTGNLIPFPAARILQTIAPRVDDPAVAVVPRGRFGPMTSARGFDRLARVYRPLELLAFGRGLERARFALLDRLAA